MKPSAPASPPVAVILAAGMGLRLRAVAGATPKGLMEIAGEPILARTVRALRAAGVAEVVLVTGWEGERYRIWCAAECPAAVCVENAAFAITGSLRSLLIGAAAVPDRDIIIVESDLIFEPRAPRLLRAAPSADTLLVSGFTQGGDEVWVYPDATDRLQELTKTARPGGRPLGELVGLTRLAAPTVVALRAAAERLPAAANYEDGLNAIVAMRPVDLLLVPDLAWAEIDDPAQWARAQTQIWPRIAAAASH